MGGFQPSIRFDHVRTVCFHSGIQLLLRRQKPYAKLAIAVDKGCKVAAICAAPVILAGMGLLDGRKAVCYPGMEGSMGAADVQVGSKVVVDGNFITGQGPGAAFDFALKLVEVLKGAAVMEQVKEEIHYQ